MAEDKNILDWEDLSKEDQERAEELLRELNQLFNRYSPKKDKKNEEILPE